jgi:hypothetical protein
MCFYGLRQRKLIDWPELAAAYVGIVGDIEAERLGEVDQFVLRAICVFWGIVVAKKLDVYEKTGVVAHECHDSGQSAFRVKLPRFSGGGIRAGAELLAERVDLVGRGVEVLKRFHVVFFLFVFAGCVLLPM